MVVKCPVGICPTIEEIIVYHRPIFPPPFQYLFLSTDKLILAIHVYPSTFCFKFVKTYWPIHIKKKKIWFKKECIVWLKSKIPLEQALRLKKNLIMILYFSLPVWQPRPGRCWGGISSSWCSPWRWGGPWRTRTRPPQAAQPPERRNRFASAHPPK